MTSTSTIETPDGLPLDRGERIALHVERTDRDLASWLDDLATFDEDQDWALDGQTSAAHWLMWRCRMARATAFDRLRVAHQLRVRPGLAAALGTGRASYSAIRLITRATGAEPDVDRALLDLAEHGTVQDVEAAVRAYLQHRDQDRPPVDPEADTFVHLRRAVAGMADGALRGPETDMAEAAAILTEFEQDLWDAEHPDRTTTDEPPRPGGARRFEALMVALRMASAHRRNGGSLDPGATSDRFIVNYVHIVEAEPVQGTAPGDGQADGGPPTGERPPANPVLLRADGGQVDPAQAGCVACDSVSVHHDVTETGEPLGIGRASRDWTRPQRRAAALRDGRQCRHPGCHRHIVDLHHQRWWSKGGTTDIDNAISLCRTHHRLQHQGFRTVGNPNGELTFLRPDGRAIGTTRPHRPRPTIQSPRETPVDPRWGWWAA